jgi:nitrate/TMAO reductase-like tetraheme cytochrome c subunit
VPASLAPLRGLKRNGVTYQVRDPGTVNDKVGITHRLKRWLFSLPKAALVGGALALTAAFVTAAIYAYRTYDYIQHDNDFCLSCHLMEDPFQRFARSAHRGLGCKACHQPTIITRSEMALTQIIENPDTLETHAEVPNERCAACHIKGDPQEWTLIANSAGHRVHLQSKDPALQGLQCVQCHSSSLHEFAAVDKTCGQAGCHENIRVRLGKMGNLTIHCVACHSFSKPVADSATVSTARVALRPTRSECLSCHAMRAMVEMPPNDPHGGDCSSCHDPHTQTTPAQAVESCGNAGCHTRPDTITAFHRGLAPRILQNCIACHPAHSFRAPGTDCIACHTNVSDPGDVSAMRPGGGMRMQQPPDSGTHPTAALPSPAPADRSNPWRHVTRAGPVTVRFASTRRPDIPRVPVRPASARQQAAPQQARTVAFKHGDHRTVACTECHATADTHGSLKVVTQTDCRSCHHSARYAEGPQGCALCHSPDSLGARTIERTQVMQFSDGKRYTRSLPFSHANHTTRACIECHTEGINMSTASLQCTQCHAEHHEPDTDCTSCHQKPPAGVHDAKSHLGCNGAGCHQPSPVVGVPRTRSFCIACHVEQVSHKTGRNCIECHPLPPPTGGGTASNRKDVP